MYIPIMADTTIKLDSAVRDRFSTIARQRGMSLRELMAELAQVTPTPEEIAVRRQATLAYIRENLCPDLTDDMDDEDGQWAREVLSAAKALQSGDDSLSSAA